MNLFFQQLGVTGTLALATAVLEFNPLLQTMKAWKAGKVEDVSWGTFATIFVIGGIWLVYGFTIGNVPLVVANVIKLFSAGTVIVTYYLLKKKS